MKTILLAALLFFSSLAAANFSFAGCRTVVLPESDGHGGTVTIQPGSNYIIQYAPPQGAMVNLQFWSHAFPSGAEANTQYLLVYLNDRNHGARRIFHAWNAGPEYETGYAINFPMAIQMNPEQGEFLIVNWLNNTSVPVNGFLMVTLRECFL